MKILITGATGFVGKAILSGYSLKKGVDIEIVTRGLLPFNSIPENVKVSVTDFASEEFTKYCLRANFDVVIHAAWENLPNLSPNVTEKNLGKSARFLNAVSSNGSKIIYVLSEYQ